MNYSLNISLQSKLIISVIAIAFIVLILSMVYRRKLSESMALLWITATLVGLLAILSSKILFLISYLLGIHFGAIALSLLIFVFLILILIYLSTKLSILSEQNRKMAQKTALLEFKLRKLTSKEQ